MSKLNVIKEASESLATIKGIDYNDAWMIIIQTMSDFEDNLPSFGSNNVRVIEVR